MVWVGKAKGLDGFGVGVLMMSSWMDCVEGSVPCAIWDRWRGIGEGGMLLGCCEGEGQGIVDSDLCGWKEWAEGIGNRR